jgi:hypothetical protein
VTSPRREPGATISHRSVAPSSALLGPLAECTLPHEVVEPLEALALAELDALATSSTVLLPRSLPILSEFYLDVAAGMEAQRLVAELAVHLVIDADTIRVGSRNALVRLLYGLDPADPIPPSLPENPLEFSVLAAFDVLPAGFWELIATGVRDLEETVRAAALAAEGVDGAMPESCWPLLAGRYRLRSRSCPNPPARRGSRCCPAGGWWNAPSRGWYATAGSITTTNGSQPPLRR